MAFNLDEVTELTDSSVFRLVETYDKIQAHFETDLLEGLMLTIDMDQTIIQRNGYTLLDLFSDVGGLQGILITGTSFILSILNHNNLDNYLVSRLFKSSRVSMTSTHS